MINSKEHIGGVVELTGPGCAWKALVIATRRIDHFNSGQAITGNSFTFEKRYFISTVSKVKKLLGKGWSINSY